VELHASAPLLSGIKPSDPLVRTLGEVVGLLNTSTF
jgi:hypothetical protein